MHTQYIYVLGRLQIRFSLQGLIDEQTYNSRLLIRWIAILRMGFKV